MKLDITAWTTMMMVSAPSSVVGFTTIPSSKSIKIGVHTRLYSTEGDIISPFDSNIAANNDIDLDDYDEDEDDLYADDDVYYDEPGFDESSPAVSPELSYTATEATEDEEGPLELTWENVDLVLEEMRPFLIADGGNVAISEIDGPVVRLELQGACGTCPSSTQTMKMGLERKLREKIPEIQEVVQSMPEGPELADEQVNVVLDGVRPFLQVAGGSIEIDSIQGAGGLQPTITLKMEGASASLNSVKLEIAQRLQRHFMLSGMRVEWEE